MKDNTRRPLYPIGIVAELLGLHPRTLRTYEQEGLIKPARRGGKRFYSDNDLQWLKCLRKLLAEDRLNIAGVKKLLTIAPCWSIRGCSEEERRGCPALLDIPLPCWEIKGRCRRGVETCSECEVYMKKMNHVMGMVCSDNHNKS
ncbi:MAG: MerR family transcriptional regulator [Syntrophobacteraceae bacterium]